MSYFLGHLLKEKIPTLFHLSSFVKNFYFGLKKYEKRTNTFFGQINTIFLSVFHENFKDIFHHIWLLRRLDACNPIDEFFMGSFKTFHKTCIFVIPGHNLLGGDSRDL